MTGLLAGLAGFLQNPFALNVEVSSASSNLESTFSDLSGIAPSLEGYSAGSYLAGGAQMDALYAWAGIDAPAEMVPVSVLGLSGSHVTDMLSSGYTDQSVSNLFHSITYDTGGDVFDFNMSQASIDSSLLKFKEINDFPISTYKSSSTFISSSLNQVMEVSYSEERKSSFRELAELELETGIGHFEIEPTASPGIESSTEVALPWEGENEEAAVTVIPTDGIFPYQWHLQNTASPGNDLNVTGVWDDYTGQGVVVGIFDQGVQYNHPDLAANYRHDLDYDVYNNDSDGGVSRASDVHGTAVAGMIAGAFDGSGSVGVAPDAWITSYRGNLYLNSMEYHIDDGFRQALINDVDVLNNSWGMGVSQNHYFYDDFNGSLFSDAARDLEALASDGRDGLGMSVIFSAGNGANHDDNVNYHNFQNSPYVISVGATTSSGTSSSFSTPGAAVLVSAPGSSVMTTDRTGSDGYDSGDYVSISGTSFSAPAVAGVTALMYEANAYLGYRDVQEILAYSATSEPTIGGNWQTNGTGNWNGAGLTVSDDFGFGLVDAHAAVRLAETWTSQGTFANQTFQSGTVTTNATISDYNTTFQSLSFSQGLEIDHVTLDLDLKHTDIGDLVITLMSPDGTVSTLLDRPNSSSDNINFQFSSVQFWGEQGVGQWTLGVKDNTGGNTGYIDDWSLTLWGDALDENDTYIYTSEWANVGNQGIRQALIDSAGEDTLNFAAISDDVIVDLTPGTANTLLGQTLSIDATTHIENAIGGDGSDVFIGNSSDNALSGMRGDDNLSGGEGDDVLDGGAGNDNLNGGSGQDTADFSGNSSAYNIVNNGDGTGSVTRISTGETDTLSGIEFLRFDDQTIQFISSNAAPVPLTTEISATEDGGSAGSLQATDADNDDLTFALVAAPASGNLTLNSNGTYNFDTAGAFEGLDDGETQDVSFTYSVSDGTETVQQTATITVSGANDAPDAQTTAIAAMEDNGASGTLLADDADAETLTFALVSGPAAGTLTLNADGSYNFDTAGAFEGLDDGETQDVTFTYSVSDGTETTEQTATITVTGSNDAPEALSAALTVSGMGDTSGLLEAIDADGDVLSYALVSGPSEGALTINSDGSYQFDALGSFDDLGHGETLEFTFTYSVSDGSDTVQKTATLTVTGANQAPDALTTQIDASENDGAAGTLLASDADNDSLTFALVSGPAAGTITVNADGSYNFDAAGAFEGLDDGETQDVTFTYSVSDGTETTEQTATITVSGSNDAPDALTTAITATEDNGASGSLLADDADTETLTFALVSGPAAGTITVNADGSYNFDTAGAFEGLDDGETQDVSFTYSVSDGTETTEQTATITVSGSNDAPDALTTAIAATEDNGASGSLLANDADTETLTFALVSGPAAGTITVNADGSYNFDTAGAFEGLDDGETQDVSFTYSVSDGTETTEQTATITVSGSNDAPDALTTAIAATEDGGASGTLLASDVDTETLTFALVSGPAAGTLTVNADGSYNFDTAGAFEGLDDGETQDVSFTYSVSDGTETVQQTATITVSGANDAPDALTTAIAATEDNGASGTLLADDADAETLTFALVSGPAAGNITINADGSYIFDTAGAFEDLVEGETQDVTFTYSVSDGTESIQQTATITVAGANEDTLNTPPIAVTSDLNVFEDGNATGMLEATDADGDDLIFALVTSPNEGSLTIDPDGSYSFDPSGAFETLNEGETRELSFTYSVSDGENIVEKTASISVAGSNDAPIIDVLLSEGGWLGEVGVNTEIAGSQTNPEIAALEDGGYIVTWQGPSAPGDGQADGISLQRFDALGQKIGGEVLVNTSTLNRQSDSKAVGLSDGGYVVAWQTDANSTIDVVARRFDSDGTPLGDEFPLSSNANGYEYQPSLSSLSTGGFVSVWHVSGNVIARVFGADGAPVSDDINITPGSSFSDIRTEVTELTDGKILVTWAKLENGGSTGPNEVYARILDSNGTPLESEFKVGQTERDPDTGSFNPTRPSTTALEDGGAVIVWHSKWYSDTDNGNSISIQRVDANGEITGDLHTLDASVINNSSPLGVDALPDGGFIVSWGGYVEGTNQYEALAAKFKADGSLNGEVFQVNQNAQNLQYLTEVATLKNGDIAYTWITLDPAGGDTNSYGIASRVYQSPTDGVPIFIEGANAVSIASGVVLSDIDSPELVGATIQISDGLAPDEDVLIFSSPSGSGISGDYDNTTGTLVLSGNASIDQYQAALRAITYSNSSNSPSQQDREITLQVDDGSTSNNLSNNVVVSVTVVSMNDAPVALTSTISANEDAPANGNLLASDADGDTLTFELVSEPSLGSISISPEGAYVFDAAGAFEGLDDGETQDVSFTYSVSDGTETIQQTATITVSGANDAPDALTTTIAATEDNGASGTLLADDADAETLTFALVSGPAAGTITVNADGSYNFDTAGAFEGLDDGETQDVSFTYSVSDGTETVQQTATITVSGSNDAPDALTTAIAATEDGGASGSLLADDADTETLTFALVSGPAAGTITVNTDGSYNFDTAGAFEGLDDGETQDVSFTYSVSDGTETVQQTATITVSGANDAPDAQTTTIAATEDNGASGTLLADDADAETLTFALVSGPAAGSITINADGTYNFDTAGAFEGLNDGETQDVSFTYSVSDGTETVQQTATIKVTGANDAPIISVSLPEGERFEDEILVNTTKSGIQYLPTSISLADGGHAVLWASGASGQSNVMFQIYDANSDAVGGETRINSSLNEGARALSAEPTTDGGFVAIWVNGDDATVSGQKYDSSGLEIGAEFTVKASVGFVTNTTVTELPDGNIIASWVQRDAAGGDSYDVLWQKMDNAGQLIGDANFVSADVSGVQTVTNIAGQTDGSFVISYLNSSAPASVQAQYIDSSGDPQADSIVVGLVGATSIAPRVEALETGGYVITWVHSDDKLIRVQELDAVGEVVGTPIILEPAIANFNSAANIVGLSNGGYVVTWNAAYDIVAQRFDSDHNPIGDLLQVNELTNSFQESPDVSENEDGSLVFVWRTRDADSGDADNGGIASRTFYPASDDLQFNRGDDPLLVASSFSLTDIDGDMLNGATIHISSGFVSGQDILGFVAPDGSGIVGEFNVSTGMLTLSGEANLSVYQAAIQSLTYSNTSSTPDVTDRQISIQVDDGSANNGVSNVVVITVGIAYSNAAPTPETTEIGAAEDGLSSGNLAATDSDGDVLTFALVTGPESGELTINSDGSYVFDAADAFEALQEGETQDLTFVYSVSDGTETVQQTATITVTGSNEAPTLVFAEPSSGGFSSETLVNTTTDGSQQNPYVIPQSDGGYAVVWNGGATNEWELFAQLYNSDGNPNGDEIQFSDIPSTGVRTFDLAGTNDGNLIVTWGSSSFDTITARTFDMNGSALGPEVAVTPNDGGIIFPGEVAAHPDGGFISVWAEYGAVGGSSSDIVWRRFDDEGNPVTDAAIAHTAIENAQTGAEIAIQNDGSFVVAYLDNTNPVSVKAQFFDSDGNRAEETVSIDAVGSGSTFPSLAALEGSGFAITWADPADGTVQVQLLASDGSLSGPQRTLDEFADVNPTSEITPLSDGGFIVTWSAEYPSNIFAQRFDETGSPVDEKQQINELEYGSERHPNVAELSDGSIVYVWATQDPASGDSNLGIAMRVFEPASSELIYNENDAPIVVGERLTINDVDSDTLTGALVTISEAYAAGQDVLAFSAPDGSGITGNFDAGTGVLTLSGIASLADYQTALAGVTYSNSSATPNETDREISFQLNDGSEGNNLSNVVSVTVSVVDQNVAPVAASLSVSANEDESVSGTLLASDADGDALTFALVSGTETGNLTINADGSFSFDPAGGFETLGAGEIQNLSFTYSVSDGVETVEQIATLTVTGSNDGPVAIADTAETIEDTSVFINISDLLTNDTDAEGDGIEFVSVLNAIGGAASVVGQQIIFVPEFGFQGDAGFTYSITDGTAISQGSVTVSVEGVSVNLTGTAGDDNLVAGIGNDTLQGGGGTDNLAGGRADDTYLYGSGDGADTIIDASGSDQIVLLANSLGDVRSVVRDDDDLVIQFADGGSITVSNQFSDAQIEVIVDQQTDVDGATLAQVTRLIASGLSATNSADFVAGTVGNDIMSGLNGNDAIYGGAGDDTISGGSGSDIVVGGEGDDALDGGSSNDTYRYSIGDGSDVISDGAGRNTLELAFEASEDVVSSIRSGDDLLVSFTDGGSVRIANHYNGQALSAIDDGASYSVSTREDLIGGNGNDWISGTEGADTIDARGGNDALFGGAGDDVLIGGSGENLVVGGSGSDTFAVSTLNGITTIADLSVTDGDVIDISSVVTGFDHTSDINNFVSVTTIDADGDGGIDDLSLSITSNGNDSAPVSVINILNMDATNLDLPQAIYARGENTGPVAVDDKVVGQQGQVLTINSSILIENDTDADGDPLTITAVAAGENGHVSLDNGSITFTADAGFHGITSFTYTTTDDRGMSDVASVEVTIEPTSFIEGNAIDGYIEGAVVFSDSNENGQLDDGESWTTTGVDGFFKLADADGPLVMTGGTDVSTGLAFTGVMRAPDGATVITPLTTLIASMVDSGVDVGSAKDLLAEALNLSADIDVLNFDPVEGTLSSDAAMASKAAQVMAQGIAVQNTIIQVAAAMTSEADTDMGAAFASVADAVAAHLTDMGADADIADATQMAEIISEVVPSLSSLEMTNIGTIAAASNAASTDAVATGATGTTLLANLAQIGLVSQGAGATAIANAIEADSTDELIDVATQFTGEGLAEAVSAAASAIGDVDGATHGTSGNDRILGTSGNDTIDGQDGADRIYGRDGDDSLLGGDGNDTIQGEEGADELQGGNGNDRLYADSDDTVVDGGDGYDRLYARGEEGLEIDLTESSIEEAVGGAGDDTFDASGSTGQVRLYGNDGDDALTGGDGNDYLRGDTGDDVLVGSGGNDTLDGRSGADTLQGGTGDDRLYVDADDTSIDGGEGYDRLYAQGEEGLNLDIASAKIEEASGSAGDDVFDASDALERVRLYGKEGDDYLSGGAGDDYLRGDEGNDVISGGAGNDTIEGKAGADQLTGGAGDDRLLVDADDTLINGGEGYDRVYVQGEDGVSLDLNASDVEEVTGNVGNDVLDGTDATERVRIYGRDGDDTVSGGADADHLRGDAGNDIINGGAGNDILEGNDGADQLQGGAGDDRLYADAHDTVIDGGDGYDRLYVKGDGGVSLDLAAANIEEASGNVGDDHFDGATSMDRIRMYGNDGDDVLAGGAGDDYLRGDAGDDELSGGAGNDTLDGKDGADELRGGAGDDRLYGDADDTVIEGGDGYDRLYVTNNQGLNINLATASIEEASGNAGNDLFNASEMTERVRLYGKDGNDFLAGGAGSDHLRGDGGNDILSGGAGNDTLEGKDGADELRGGSGDDRLYVDGDDTIIDGGDGYDRLYVQGIDGVSLDLATASIEDATGATGDDIFDGGSSADAVRLYGRDGADQLTGGSGNDYLRGDGGDDTLNGGAGNDYVIGGSGSDELRTGSGDDRLYVDGDDTIIDGGAGYDRLYVQGVDGVSLDLAAASIEEASGATGDDVFDGGASADAVRLYGRDGADQLTGGSGNDHLGGDGGDDTLNGGAGNDYLNGGSGSDELRAGSGDDRLYVDGDDTIIDGGDGYDRLYVQGVDGVSLDLTAASIEEASGATGDDIFDGGSSADAVRLYGRDGADQLTGGSGNDYLRGDGGDDTLNGGAGNDYVIGGSGSDELRAGSGDDRLYVDGDDTIIDGGAGYDRLYVQGIDGVSLDLATASIEDATGAAGDDIFDGGSSADAVRLYGKDGADQLTGGSGNDYLRGDGGDDTLIGGAGNDYLIGGAGADTLRGGAGDDRLYVDSSDVVAEGGDGYDRLYVQGAEAVSSDVAANSFEEAYGGAGDDQFDAGAATERVRLYGNDGDDILTGGSADDFLRGDLGADILSGGGGNDTLEGRDGDDTLTGGGGADRLYGGAGDDLFLIDSNDSVIRGGTGVDTLQVVDKNGVNLDVARSEIEVAIGGDGNDVLDASNAQSSVSLSGGSGDDTLTGGIGDDVLYGGAGDDFLLGGLGLDRFDFDLQSGSDIIGDFEVGQDHLALAQDLTIIQYLQNDVNADGINDLVIELDNNETISLLGISDDTDHDNLFA